MLKRILGIFGAGEIFTESEVESSLKKESLERTRKRLEAMLAQTKPGEEVLSLMQEEGERIAKEDFGINFKDVLSVDIFRILQEKASTPDLCLVLAAYTKKLSPEDLELLIANSLPRLAVELASEKKKGRFDENNSVDTLSLKVLFDSMGEKLVEVDSDSDLELVGVNLNNVLKRYPELANHSLDLIKELFVRESVEAKMSSWRIMEESLDLSQVVEIIAGGLDSKDDWSSLFLEKQISIVAKKLGIDEDNRDANLGRPVDLQPSDYEEDFETLCQKILGKKNSLKQKGHYDIAIDALAKYFGKQTWLHGNMPNELREKVVACKVEKKRERKKIDLAKETKSYKDLDDLGFDFLGEAASLLEEADRARLVEYLAASDDESFMILKNIFKVADSMDLSSDYFYTTRGRIRANVDDVFLNEYVQKMFLKMMEEKNRDKFSMELALMLSLVPLNSFDERIQEKIAVYMKDDDMRVLPMRDGWYLCSLSEIRLVKSMMKGEVVLINDNLMMKLDGKQSVLSLVDFTDEDGDQTFVKGVWYAPIDRATRAAANKAYSEGKMSLKLKGKWAVMRSMSDDETEGTDLNGEFLLEECIRYAKKIRSGKVTVDRSKLTDIAEGF